MAGEVGLWDLNPPHFSTVWSNVFECSSMGLSVRVVRNSRFIEQPIIDHFSTLTGQFFTLRLRSPATLTFARSFLYIVNVELLDNDVDKKAIPPVLFGSSVERTA
jgi:hypothetical protein